MANKQVKPRVSTDDNNILTETHNSPAFDNVGLAEYEDL